MIGYFGKVPSHGDFVSKGLPPDLVLAWDTWLQQCMLESQRQLGDQWLTHYLTSPVWRFAISPGILGSEGLGGVLMPSVDRVGRYFPLMIGATGEPGLLDWFQKHAEWYEGIEELARASLDPKFGLEQLMGVAEPKITSVITSSSTGNVRRFSFDQSVGEHIAAAALQGYSLWWTEGCPAIKASILMCAGVPAPHSFSAMLDGS